MTNKVEAWLIHCWTPGKHCVFATIDENDTSWWPTDQWEGVTRTPLGIIGDEEVIFGIMPHPLKDINNE